MMLGKVSWALVPVAVVLLRATPPASGASLPPRLAALSPRASARDSAPEPMLAKPVDRAPPAAASVAAVATSTTKDGGDASNEQDVLNEPPESDADSPPPAAPSSPQGCTFFLVRHGQSKPNVAGKIVSTLEGGVDPANGLTEEGLSQAQKAGRELKGVMLQAGISPANTMVLTSPLSRARETAEAIRDCLDCELREEGDLRERGFGDFEGRNDAPSYEKVWALDALSSRHGEFGVEPASEVAARTAAVVRRVLKEVSIRRRFYTGDGQPFPPGPSAVVLVSHGDALQLLQCLLAGRPLEQHRSLPHLENCGIRALRPPQEEGQEEEEKKEGEGGEEKEGEGEEGGVEEGGGEGWERCVEGGGRGDGLREAFRMTGARVLRPRGDGEEEEGEGGEEEEIMEGVGEGET